MKVLYTLRGTLLTVAIISTLRGFVGYHVTEVFVLPCPLVHLQVFSCTSVQPSSEIIRVERGTHLNDDFSNLQPTTVKFDGTNYLTWSRSIIIHIQDRDKEDYLASEAKQSSKDDPKYRK